MERRLARGVGHEWESWKRAECHGWRLKGRRADFVMGCCLAPGCLFCGQGRSSLIRTAWFRGAFSASPLSWEALRWCSAWEVVAAGSGCALWFDAPLVPQPGCIPCFQVCRTGRRLFVLSMAVGGFRPVMAALTLGCDGRLRILDALPASRCHHVQRSIICVLVTLAFGLAVVPRLAQCFCACCCFPSPPLSERML